MALSRSQIAAIHEKDASKGLGMGSKTHLGALLKIPKPHELVESPTASHFGPLHGPKPPKPFKKRRYYGENTL